jgi:hypothetical protein
VSRSGRALPPGKDSRYPLYRRLGGPYSRSGHKKIEEKSSCLCRVSNLDSPVFQSVVRHYTELISFYNSNSNCGCRGGSSGNRSSSSSKYLELR